MPEEQYERESQYKRYPPPKIETALHQFLLSPQEIIEDIRHTFLGEIESIKPEGDTLIQSWERDPSTSKIINEKGLNSLLGALKPYISKVFITSDLKDEEIYKITHEFADSITVLLMVRYKEFEIKPEMRDIIQGILVNAVFVTLKRALNGAYQELIKNVTKMEYLEKIQKMPEKKDMFNIFKPKI